MRQFLVVSYLSLLALHAFDVYSTYTVLNLGAEEANPIMDLFMKAVGVIPAMLITKGVFFILLTIACIKAIKMKTLSTKENVALYGTLIILVTYYSYFMYTRNLRYLLALT